MTREQVLLDSFFPEQAASDLGCGSNPGSGWNMIVKFMRNPGNETTKLSLVHRSTREMSNPGVSERNASILPVRNLMTGGQDKAITASKGILCTFG